MLDSNCRLPPSLELVRTAREVPTWVVIAEDAPLDRAAPLTAAGARLLRVPRAADGRLDLRQTLQLLAAEGITRLFSEGGPHLAGALAEADLLDEVLLFTASASLDAPGLPALAPSLAEVLDDGARLRLTETRSLGADRLDRWTRVA